MADFSGENNFLNDAASNSEVKSIDEQISDHLFISFDDFLKEVNEKNMEKTSDLSQTAEINDSNGDVNNSDISEIQGWLGEINPNFNPYDYDPAFENNCGWCSFAVSRRLDGDTEAYAYRDNITTKDGMKTVTGHKFIETSSDEVAASLIRQGPGAHAIIGISRDIGSGHWFNAYYDGNKVYRIDGQVNCISEWPPDNLGNVTKWIMEDKESK